jgi:hypothetical protein
MPYTDVDIFREKGTKSFGATAILWKNGSKKIIDFFVVIYSKLSHSDKNLNLNLN